MAKKECSKCGVSFTCTNETSGCWCENLALNTETLQLLKENYENCLCPNCLTNYHQNQKKTL